MIVLNSAAGIWTASVSETVLPGGMVARIFNSPPAPMVMSIRPHREKYFELGTGAGWNNRNRRREDGLLDFALQDEGDHQSVNDQ